MITTGVVGKRWRASITPWGRIEPWDGSAPLDWYVAADDRWHVPRHEPAVRQTRVDGTPVTETRLRVPGGDVVQTVYSCADSGGVTVVEVANESSLPVAIAFDRRDVLTERPIADVPIANMMVEGIDLPADAFVMPVGHGARIRVGLAHVVTSGGALPALPAAAQVARGWVALAERASRFVLPEGEGGAALARRVISERCEVVLGGVADPLDDRAAFVVAVSELVRAGEAPAGGMVAEVAAAVESLGADASWEAGVALAAAARLLAAAGEARAVRDVERILAGRPGSAVPTSPPAGVIAVPWLESQFAVGAALFPNGLPPGWRGASIEAHGVPTGPSSTVSLAVRWHGARPAVLWEQQGSPVLLSAPVVAPSWSSREPAGEALWPVPS
jgi:hypothetical protein